eukprot:gene8301-11232_t
MKGLLNNYSNKKRSTSSDGNKPNKDKNRRPVSIVQHDTEFIHPSVALAGDFATIGKSHGTDKVTHHGYHRFYPRYLKVFRSLPGNKYGMLEIGIESSNSLLTWLDYFPSFFVYGIDIGVSETGEKYNIFKCDQSDLSQVQAARNEMKHDICFIIDDGSHIPEHQLLCFDYLFNELLINGGIYIIEDIETSYWRRNGLYGYKTNYGYGHPNSVMEVMKLLLDDINREFLTEENRVEVNNRLQDKISNTTRSLISSVTFGQNCIIIVKKTLEEMEKYGDRHYRFQTNL